MSIRFHNDSPGALTLEQARTLEIKRQKERRRQAEELAAQGRGEDTEIAHVARGEIVVPEALQTPEFLAAVRHGAKAAGIPFERLRVGSAGNSINPKTGVAEFDPYVVTGGPIGGIDVITAPWTDINDYWPWTNGPGMDLSGVLQGLVPEVNRAFDRGYYVYTGPEVEEVTVNTTKPAPARISPFPPTSIYSFRDRVSGSQPYVYEGPVDPGMLPGVTVSSLVPLPQNYANTGYYHYSTPRDGRGQYGTPKAINLLGQVGAQWHADGRKPFGVGNISIAGGGPFRDHIGHQKGRQIDIRPIRVDGAQEGGATWQSHAYDRVGTQSLVNKLLATGVARVIRFNDPEIQGVTPDRIDPKNPSAPRTHDNHLDVELYP